VLAFDDAARPAGTLLTLAVAGAVVAYGIRRGEEAFILYASVYAVVAVDSFALNHIRGATTMLLYLVVSSIAAIVGLFMLHSRYKRRET
jgi:hypothetical protein